MFLPNKQKELKEVRKVSKYIHLPYNMANNIA